MNASRSSAFLVPVLLLACSTAAASDRRAAQQMEATDYGEQKLRALLFPSADLEAIRAQGRGVLAGLAKLYERSTEDEKAVIAWAFYTLGWKSAEAKRVLMADAHTPHEALRLQVQWALGRVSNDPDVVDVLVGNMRDDANPLFRDKAACALAHDQIHLTEEQKVRLYERLIQALSDPKPQVREIAIKVLGIQTGQTKGFNPGAPPAQREQRIREWQRWLEEYRSQLQL